MARWSEFERSAPEMAAAGQRLLEQFGLGLGFLATVRPDGAPRLHPICPIVAHGGWWGFTGDSPKRRALQRHGRFALHSFPPVEVDDEFVVDGLAREVADPDVIAAVRAAYRAPIQTADELLFEFEIE